LDLKALNQKALEDSALADLILAQLPVNQGQIKQLRAVLAEEKLTERRHLRLLIILAAFTFAGVLVAPLGYRSPPRCSCFLRFSCWRPLARFRQGPASFTRANE